MSDPLARSSSFTAEADSEWICEYTVTQPNAQYALRLIGIAFSHLAIENQVTNDGPVYSLCCLDGKVVSAGASNKISIWRPAMERSEVLVLCNHIYMVMICFY